MTIKKYCRLCNKAIPLQVHGNRNYCCAEHYKQAARERACQRQQIGAEFVKIQISNEKIVESLFVDKSKQELTLNAEELTNLGFVLLRGCKLNITKNGDFIFAMGSFEYKYLTNNTLENQVKINRIKKHDTTRITENGSEPRSNQTQIDLDNSYRV